jgi:hypothetical protein
MPRGRVVADRVFTENDVVRIVEGVLAMPVDRFRALDGFEAAQEVVRDARSELAEEVIARSAAARLVEEAANGLWEPNSEDVVELDGEAFLDNHLPRLAPAEPVVKRSHADRLVALALVWGAWDYGGLDHVWDGLFKDGLIREAGDQAGERWSVLTDKGEAFLRAELERDR